MDNNNSKECLINSFFSLLESVPYEKINVSEICDNAGVSRMSFYRNFKSKEDLVLSAFWDIEKEIKKKIEQLEQKNTYTMAKVYFEVFQNYSVQVLALLDNPIVSKCVADIVMKRLNDNAPEDYIHKANRYIPYYYYGSITYVLLAWIRFGAKETPDEMARLICKLDTSHSDN